MYFGKFFRMNALSRPKERAPQTRRLVVETLEDRFALDASPYAAPEFPACAAEIEEPLVSPIAVIGQERYYVQENCSVCVSGADSVGDDLRYFWRLGTQPSNSPDSFVELGDRFELSALDLKLATGDYCLQLFVKTPDGTASETTQSVLTVTPSGPTFTVDADSSLGNGALVLNVQAYAYCPIATWTIDWGDGSTTQTDALGYELSTAHFYPERYEDVVYPITLTVVDSLGRGEEEVYELAVVDVPAADPISSFVVDALYDAEKGSYTQSQICWAAGTANVLCYTGWANSVISVYVGGYKLSLTDEDDVYEYMAQTFDNIGSSALYGYQWFITGEYQAEGVAGWAQPEPGTGGFYPDLENFWSLVKYCSYANSQNPTSILPLIEDLIRQGYGSTASLGFYVNNPGSRLTLAHTITLWGFETDARYEPTDPRHYVALYISDSDNDAYKGRNAPNTMQKVHVQWDADYNRYKLTDYRSGICWLEEFIALAPITVANLDA